MRPHEKWHYTRLTLWTMRSLNTLIERVSRPAALLARRDSGRRRCGGSEPELGRPNRRLHHSSCLHGGIPRQRLRAPDCGVSLPERRPRAGQFPHRFGHGRRWRTGGIRLHARFAPARQHGGAQPVVGLGLQSGACESEPGEGKRRKERLAARHLRGLRGAHPGSQRQRVARHAQQELHQRRFLRWWRARPSRKPRQCRSS